MIQAVLFGACGRMGRIISEVFLESASIQFVAGVENADHPAVGSEIDGIPIFGSMDELPESQVWLDFSLANVAVEHFQEAAKRKIPIVIAATGFNQEQLEQLNEATKICPVLMAPNLSLGVGVTDKLVELAAKILDKSYQPVIVESHHRSKKDKPSGTALRLASQIEAEAGAMPEIHSVRAGGVIGEHRIIFYGQNEELEICHRAYSRKAFTSGIKLALKFILDQDAGLYTLKDLYADV